jgi:predicted DNA-binding protein YlxM (UPF0122 family)
MIESENEFYSLNEAAQDAKITRQGVYIAIRKGGLKATKTKEPTKYSKRGQWVIKKADLDEYRANKYNRDKRKVEGESLFDLDRGYFSVNHVAKIMGKMLNHRVPTAHIYYMIRKGDLRAYKKGGAWVIKKEDAIALYEKESGNTKEQMRFA